MCNSAPWILPMCSLSSTHQPNETWLLTQTALQGEIEETPCEQIQQVGKDGIKLTLKQNIKLFSFSDDLDKLMEGTVIKDLKIKAGNIFKCLY